MPIRAACPSCAAILSAPDTAAGKLIRCPKCEASVRLPKPKTSPPMAAANRSAAVRPQEEVKEDQPRKPLPAPDEEEDRPRKKSRKKQKKGAGSFVWVLAAVGAVLVVVLGVGGFFAVRAVVGTKDKLTAGLGEGNQGLAGQGSGGGSAGAGTKYVPRVSEKKLAEFLKDRQPSDVTDDQVYAIMGEPTRREVPVTARKNGQVFTVYKAFWETPGSGVTSSIGFVNGRISGAVVGLETTPPKSGGGK